MWVLFSHIFQHVMVLLETGKGLLDPTGVMLVACYAHYVRSL